MSELLDGKVAIVTGATRGLGRAMALGFAAEGASIVVASRKTDACETLAKEIEATFPVRALPVATNVTAWDDCDALAEAAFGAFEHVDVLVNNAGASLVYPDLASVDAGMFDKVIALNLRGPFRLSVLVGEHMAAGRGGSIINISSVEARDAHPSSLPYAAAKAGLEALTTGFMRAYGPTVRVNTIRCGLFRTDISKAWGSPEEIDALARGSIVAQRIGEPHDVVGAAVYLASDASAYCTGATIQLDGGRP